MTTIIYDAEKLRIDVTGHSGYAERGKDIVCASISTAVSVLGSFAAEAEKRAWLSDVSICRVSDGSAHIGINPKVEYSDECRAVFDAVCRCLSELSRQYPDNVRYIARKS